MSVAKIQKGDKVKVISGGFKGTEGLITKVINKSGKNSKVVVSNLPKIADYQRSNKSFGVPGLKLEKDRKIDISNVALVNDEGTVSKVKIESSKEGKKIRIFKKGGSEVKKTQIKEEKDSLNSEDKK